MLSIVVPLFNEVEGLATLHQELSEVAAAQGYDAEVIFVDDGSTDGSWKVICELAAVDRRVCGLRFRRNFGKAAALSAGFEQARGELVMTLDADLQDDPHEIPRFLAEMEKKFDVINGWKKVRHDPWHKVLPSRVFNWLVSWLTGVKLHDHNCGMKCYRQEVLHEVRLYGELHRFVPVLAAARGFRVGEIAINHRTRKFGRSKYGISRFIKGFLDLLTVRFLTGFSQRPQHLLGAVGLGSFLLGALALIYLAGWWAISRILPGWEPVHLHEKPAVIYSTGLLLLGGQLMSIGFLAELFIAYHASDIHGYSVAERHGPDPARLALAACPRPSFTPMTENVADSGASLRRGVYAILMVIGLGAVLGRILAVDAVDRTALQDDRAKRVPQEVERERKLLQAMGVGGQALDERLQQFRTRLLARPSLRRPFLSSNDRSRWGTVRALVEPEMRVEGAPYAIDKVIQQPGWDTIDMVKHDGHLYSSKPPLLPTLLAGEYWLVYHVTGATLGTRPFEIGRFLLVSINGASLLIYFLALAGLAEWLGKTDWGRIFVVAAGVFGTFLTTFAVVLNNHVVAAACAAVALYYAVRIGFSDRGRICDFVLAGLFAALLAANELPALALAAALSLGLLWRFPRQTLLAFAPPAVIVAAGFFGTNWIAHHTLSPAYLHRCPVVLQPVDESVKSQVQQAVREAVAHSDAQSWKDADLGPVKAAVKAEIVEAVKRSGAAAVRKAIQQPVEEALTDKYKTIDKAAVADLVRAAVDEVDLEAERPDNWYDYAFRRDGRVEPSHWRAPEGIDRGEPSVLRYTFHCLVGHHGILSLTPMWLMSICGVILWLRRGEPRLRRLAAMIGAVTVVCAAFYLGWPSLDRNYGGMNSGFREVFWLAPAWLVVMLPVADASASRRGARGLALVLLALSVLSASYPTWNPWTHPWLMYFMQYMGWV